MQLQLQSYNKSFENVAKVNYVKFNSPRSVITGQGFGICLLFNVT